MGKSILVLMAVLAVVSARDWRTENKLRVRRGFSASGYGDDGRGFGRGSDDQDASVSRESLSGGCSGEAGGGYGGSRELEFNRDGRSPNENDRGGRAFAKSSASATAFNQNQNAKL